MRALAFLLAVLGLVGCPGVPPEEATLSSLRSDIFEPRCGFSGCHGGSGPAAGLDLVDDPFGNLVDIASDEDPNVKRVVPGDPAASLLFQVLQAPVGGTQQMPVGAEFGDEELARIAAWIENGAPND
jgi:hypothetical protein